MNGKIVSVIAGITLTSTLLLHEAIAMVKPVVGLRDYNGTYTGAPGTGTVMYRSGNNPGTLYRDNEDYGATSGCNGEGCGSHSGVDIPVTSGTPVYAILAGTVHQTIDNCTSNGWGGLIIIRSTSPYDGSTIYHSYAHLRKRNYKTNGGSVPEGAVIGESGGGPGDFCPGNSTNSHLHFQIDKNHNYIQNNKLPWFPTVIGRSVNQADSDFQVTNYTYNPMVFVNSIYNWNFDQDGFSELWTQWKRYSSDGSTGVSLGICWIHDDTDPGMTRGGDWANGDQHAVPCEFSIPGGRPCSTQIAAEAALYKYVMITMENFCISNPVKVYFTTNTSDDWSEDKMQSFNYGGPANYFVYMGNQPKWTGIIRRLRIDPAENCNPIATDPEYIYQITIVPRP